MFRGAVTRKYPSEEAEADESVAMFGGGMSFDAEDKGDVTSSIVEVG